MTPEQKLIDAAIGARLRTFREERGVSQTALGEVSGVSFQQIQKYENGANRVSASTLFLISRKLKISPAKFFHGLESVVGAEQD